MPRMASLSPSRAPGTWPVFGSQSTLRTHPRFCWMAAITETMSARRCSCICRPTRSSTEGIARWSTCSSSQSMDGAIWRSSIITDRHRTASSDRGCAATRTTCIAARSQRIGRVTATATMHYAMTPLLLCPHSSGRWNLQSIPRQIRH